MNPRSRSTYQSHLGYFTNGYSPIYFTNEDLIFNKVAPRECHFFYNHKPTYDLFKYAD